MFREEKSIFVFVYIIGFVHIYALGQVSLWIVFHAFGLLRGVAFPFFYQKIKREGALKYIHISTVVAAFTLPLVPALLHLIDGYSIVPSPVNICIGRNIAITYYSLVLPMSILFATRTTILILLSRKIIKVATRTSIILVCMNNIIFTYNTGIHC